MEMICYKILEWDTDFFRFPVAQLLNTSENFSEIKKCLEEMRATGIRLVYASGKFSGEGITSMEAIGGTYVVQKIIYRIDLNKNAVTGNDHRIVPYRDEKPNRQLTRLAIDAGIY